MNAYYDIANYCYERKLNRSHITILIKIFTDLLFIIYYLFIIYTTKNL